MRARYLGDHDNFAAWGIRFPRGVFVPVSDAHAQKKIAGNSHFEVENSDAEDVEFVETPKAAPDALFDEPADVATEVSQEEQEAPALADAERQKRPYNRRK